MPPPTPVMTPRKEQRKRFPWASDWPTMTPLTVKDARPIVSNQKRTFSKKWFTTGLELMLI